MEENLRSIFPYETLRRGQLDAIKFISDVFKEGAIGFLHAPTGIGKTIAALTAYFISMRNGREKLVVLTRTKSQAQIYIEELERIRQHVKDNLNFSYVVFRSKKDMCLIARKSARIGKLPYTIFLRVCDSLKKQGRCPYYNNCYRSGVPTTSLINAAEEAKTKGASWRNILKVSISLNVCAYEVARYLAHEADIVIGSYGYIFRPDIREKFLSSLGVTLHDIWLVIDEAHNLPDFIISALSLNLSTLTIEGGLRELRRLGLDSSNYIFNLLTSFQREFLEVANRILSGEVDGRPRLIDVSSLVNMFSKDDILSIKERGEQYISKGLDISSRLFWIAEFLDYLRTLYMADEFITTIESSKTEDGKKYYVLTLQLLDPSFEAVNIFGEIGAAILMSGSLFPIEYYRTILGLGEAELRNKVRELILPSPFPEDAFHIVVDKLCTTKYSERNEKMYSRLAARLKIICAAAPRNKAILVVFPSYELLKKIGLKADIREREIIIETRETEIEYVLDRLKTSRNVIIFSVAGGKLMEGIDYRIERETVLGIIVLVGLPFPEYNDVTRAQEAYYSKKFGGKIGRFLAIIAPAIRKALQAGGRLIRDEKDRGIVFILDRRYVEYGYWRYFPQNWRRFRIFISNEEIVETIKKFFK